MNGEYINGCEIVSQVDQLGIYGLVKKLSEVFVDKLPKSGKKELLSKSYQILLKKGESIPEVLPPDWSDFDVLNAIRIEIFKRCKIKQNWTDELRKKVLKQFETLKKYEGSEYYENAVSPALKMLLCIEYYQNKMPSQQKEPSLWFDTDVISTYLDNIKSFLPKEEGCSLFTPIHRGIHHSKSDGHRNISPLDGHCILVWPSLRTSSSSLRLRFFTRDKKFDYIFQVDKPSNDLDEGFVTPNDEHIERTPSSEARYLPPRSKNAKIKFYWDPATVTIPPSKHKTWEKYGTIGNLYKHKPFCQNVVVMQDWLRSAPASVTKISREQLLDNLMVLCVGIPSSSFLFNEEHFLLKDGIHTDDLTPVAVTEISRKFMKAAEGFRALTKLSEREDQGNEDAITQGFKISLREYLYKYQTAIICAKESLNLKETSYYKLISTLEPFIDQIVYLRNILIQEEELKGVPLLKFLFDLMGSSSNSSTFDILSSLFLLPCMYYFRLIDDWIFHGKWHKDLLMSPCDMSSVNDRPSWVAAHKASTHSTWLIPNQSLALCGKAIWLLSSSKKSEKLLSLLKSDKRPKLMVCLNTDELRILKEQCEKYYSDGKEALIDEEQEELLDPVLSAQNAALIHAEKFENQKIQEKLKQYEKKKKELILREEDLARSAHNKEIEKQREDSENKRISKELEEILLKEQQEETEKVKLVFERYQEHLELQEKWMKHADWKMRRCALNEKRKQFLLKELQDTSFILPVCGEDMNSSVIDESPIEGSEKKDDSKVSIASCDIGESAIGNRDEISMHKSLPNLDGSNKNPMKASLGTVLDDLNDNLACSQQQFLTPCQMRDNTEGVFSKTPSQKNTSEFESNRMKVLSSNIFNSNLQNMNVLKGVNENDFPLLEQNKNKILESHFDNRGTSLTNTSMVNDKTESATGNGESSEIAMNKLLSNLEGCNKNQVETSLGSVLTCSQQQLTIQYETGDDAETEDNLNTPGLEKISEFETNRMTAFSSNILNDDIQNMNVLNIDNKSKDDFSQLEQNRNKILGTHFDNRDTFLTSHGSVNVDEAAGQQETNNKLSDLEKNRLLVLGSDFGRCAQNKLHIWDEDNQRNRRNMLGSHISFAYEQDLKKLDVNTIDGIAEVALESKSENLIDLSNEISPEEISVSDGGNNEALEKVTKDSKKIAIDTQDCEADKNDCDMDIPEDLLKKKPAWFSERKSNEKNDKINQIFKFKNPSMVQNRDLDFTLLNKLVPQSLNLVLETQTKLMNEALMKMFLDEFGFLKVAQKLREYFFLHGEFGKRLTSSLSKAIEGEEPSTLLTFYRLRSILADASRGDIKEVSFIVNDTPIAFDHTNPQTLSCLGMTYRFDWPMNLIFTDKAISKYNNVFVYLFSLQRVSWHLERVCHVLHFKPADLKGDQYNKIQLYRYVMSQFVGAIQSYIVTTVIENSWQEFVADVAKLKDIDELYRRHAIYISSINFKCFLDERSKRLMVQIEKLLHFILVFCRTLLYGLWSVDENDVYSHTKFHKLRKTFDSFLYHARYVTKTVKKLVQVHYQKNLENLYYYLTINSFYIS